LPDSPDKPSCLPTQTSDSPDYPGLADSPPNGSTLRAHGHPLGADAPTATFSKAADSSPGEIYPTGPTVPSPGCWRFTLTWQDGAQRTDVDLLFR